MVKEMASVALICQGFHSRYLVLEDLARREIHNSPDRCYYRRGFAHSCDRMGKFSLYSRL